MIDPEDSALLVNLMAAADAAQPEAVILQLLATRLQAGSGRLYHSGQLWALAPSTQRTAPLPDLFAGFRLHRVYTADEFPYPKVADQRALGLRVSGNGPTWIVLGRTRGAFRSIDTARLAAYAPHVEQSLALALRLAGVAAQQKVQDIAARRMGVGLVQRERSGRSLQGDAVARDLLNAHKLTLADLARIWPRGDIGQGKIVLVAAGLDMMVVAGRDQTSQVGLLRTSDTTLPPVPLIAGALGITLAEARLARALAAGGSLSEAALDMGITEQTARFYSKQIFAKTGLSGQPALMRRIWTSALALAR